MHQQIRSSKLSKLIYNHHYGLKVEYTYIKISTDGTPMSCQLNDPFQGCFVYIVYMVELLMTSRLPNLTIIPPSRCSNLLTFPRLLGTHCSSLSLEEENLLCDGDAARGCAHIRGWTFGGKRRWQLHITSSGCCDAIVLTSYQHQTTRTQQHYNQHWCNLHCCKFQQHHDAFISPLSLVYITDLKINRSRTSLASLGLIWENIPKSLSWWIWRVLGNSPVIT